LPPWLDRPSIEALLNVLEENGVITKAEVLHEITLHDAESAKAR